MFILNLKETKRCISHLTGAHKTRCQAYSLRSLWLKTNYWLENGNIVVVKNTQ